MPRPTAPGPATHLLRAVHTIPGFVLQEVLLPEVALPTFGALEGLLPSVFPARSHRGGGAERLPASPSPSAPSGSHHVAGEPAGGEGNLPPSQLRPSSSPGPPGAVPSL